MERERAPGGPPGSGDRSVGHRCRTLAEQPGSADTDPLAEQSSSADTGPAHERSDTAAETDAAPPVSQPDTPTRTVDVAVVTVSGDRPSLEDAVTGAFEAAEHMVVRCERLRGGWDGTGWTPTDTGDADLRDIEVVNDDIAGYTVGSGGNVYELDGLWTSNQTPTGANLNAVVRGTPDIAVDADGTILER